LPCGKLGVVYALQPVNAICGPACALAGGQAKAQEGKRVQPMAKDECNAGTFSAEQSQVPRRRGNGRRGLPPRH